MKKILYLYIFISCQDIENFQKESYAASSFTRNYGNIGYDYGWNASYSQFDDGIIIVGSKEEEIGGQKQLWAIKTDNRGLALWDKSFGGDANEEGYDVISTSDGGYLFVGYTWSFGNQQQVYVIKTDLFGQLKWEKNYGGAVWDVGNAVVETSDGYVIAGFSNSPGISSGNTDFLLLKIDKGGNKIWLKSFGNKSFPNHEWAYDIVDLNSDGFMLVGARDRYQNGKKNALIIRTDKNGNKVWEKELIDELNLDEIAYSVSEDIFGNFFVCTTKNSLSNKNSYFPEIIKIDRMGNIDWQKKFESNGAVYHRHSAINSLNGDLIIVGSSIENLAVGTRSNAFLTRINNNGKILWSRSYGTYDEDDWGWSVLEKPNGNLVIVGSTKSYNSSLFDIMLIGTNDQGY